MITTIALLVGIWTTNCTQTQTPTHKGFAKDTYAFEADGSFQFKRDWFADVACMETEDQEVSAGTAELGKRLSGMFVSGETYELNFSEPEGVDLGAVTVNGGRSLKIARGMKNSTMRNTMVGFIEFIKQ